MRGSLAVVKGKVMVVPSGGFPVIYRSDEPASCTCGSTVGLNSAVQMTLGCVCAFLQPPWTRGWSMSALSRSSRSMKNLQGWNHMHSYDLHASNLENRARKRTREWRRKTRAVDMSIMSNSDVSEENARPTTSASSPTTADGDNVSASRTTLPAEALAGTSPPYPVTSSSVPSRSQDLYDANPTPSNDVAVAEVVTRSEVPSNEVDVVGAPPLIQPPVPVKSRKLPKVEEEMRKLGRRGQWRKVLSLLEGLDGPSERQFGAAIEACEAAQEPRQARRVYEMMVHSGIAPGPARLIPVVRGLLKYSDAVSALRTFQQSGFRVGAGEGGRGRSDRRRRDGKLSLLYSYGIRAAQRTRDWREAVLLYREAELLNPPPLPFTAAAVFSVCYSKGQHEINLSTSEVALARLGSSSMIPVRAALILPRRSSMPVTRYALALTFAADALKPPHEEADRRRVFMNKIIVACARAGPDHYQRAIATYEELERTLGPSPYSLTAAIDVLRRMGDWRRALILLERLAAAGVSPEDGLRTCTNAVLAAMGSANYVQARDLAARASRDWGVTSNVVTYGTLLLAASEVTLPSSASIFPSRVGSSPDTSGAHPARNDQRRNGSSTCSTRGEEGAVGRVLRKDARCCDGDAKDESERGKTEPGTTPLIPDTVELLGQAARDNAVPGEACLNMTMFNLARSGAWAEAAAFIRNMERLGLKISRTQREALVGALCAGEQWGDAVLEVNRMLAGSVVVDDVTAGLAVKAYSGMGLKEHWAEAVYVLKRAYLASRGDMDIFYAGAVKEEPDMGASAWRVLLMRLVREGMRDEAVVALKQMHLVGVPFDEDTGTGMIQAAYKSGDYTGVVWWLHRLRQAELRVCHKGYATALNACQALGQHDAARGVFDAMIAANVKPTHTVYNVLLKSLGLSFTQIAEADQNGTRERRSEESRDGAAGVKSVASIGQSGCGVTINDDIAVVAREGNEDNGRVWGSGGEEEDETPNEITISADVDEGQGSLSGRAPGPDVVALAEQSWALYRDMLARDVRPDGVTYVYLITAMLSAERIDDVLSLWETVWTDPGAALARVYVARRVLHYCQTQRRGQLASRLVQLGTQFTLKDSKRGAHGMWPDKRAFRTAIQACVHEGGGAAWREARVLLEERERIGLQPDEYFVAKAIEVVQSAVDRGLTGASEALRDLRLRTTASEGRQTTPDEDVKPGNGSGGASKPGESTRGLRSMSSGDGDC